MIAVWISLLVVQAVALIIGNVVLIVAAYDWLRGASQRWKRRRRNARSGTVRFPVPPMGRHRS